MTTVDDILAAAQALPSNERAQLIHALWATIQPSDWPPPTDGWIEETQRRSEAYDQGKMGESTWSELRQRARRKAGLDG